MSCDGEIFHFIEVFEPIKKVIPKPE
jgi:hypothetical protein